MKTSARWMLLLAMAGLVTGVALWLGQDTSGGIGTTPTVPRRGADSDSGMTAPRPVVPDTDQPSIPRPLTLEPAPDAEPADRDHAAAAAGPRVTVIGRLVSPHGRPIANALVALMDDPAPGLQAMIIQDEEHEELGIGRDTTGSDGSFRIEAPLPEAEEPDELPVFLGDMFSDRARLLVRHPHFVSGHHPLPALVEGVVDAGTLVLEEAGSLVGRVLTAAGETVADARVAAQAAREGAASLGDLFGLISGDPDHATSSDKTGEDGSFLLAGLAPGLYDLAVRARGHPRFVLQDVHIDAGRPTSVGDVFLAQGTLLGGVVRDGNGDPVPDIKVRSSRQSPEGLDSITDLSMRLMLGESYKSSGTDEQGRFLISGVGEGQHDLQVGGRHTGWSLVEEDDVPGGTRDLELVVHELGELLVTVRETTDGPPLAGAELRAERVDDDEDLEVLGGAALRTRNIPGVSLVNGIPEGVFLLEGAGRQGTDISASADGYATTRFRAPPVLDGSQVLLTVLLVPESVLEGIVLDDAGRPVADAEVEARAQEASSEARSAVGQVESAKTVQDPSIAVQRMLGIDSRDSVKALTDATGSFRLTGLGAGDWEVSASADDFVPSAAQVVKLAADHIVRDLQLVVVPGGAIVGRVTEAGDVPVAGARIHIAPVRRGGFSFGEDSMKENLTRNLAASFGVDSAEQRTLRTGSDGRFESRGLSAGEYTVTLKKESTAPITLDFGSLLGAPPPTNDGRTVQVTVVAREEVVADFVRSQRAAITVRVTAGGQPVEGASVSFSDTSSSLFGIDLSFGGNVERTDAIGIARFEELEPATYKITASVPGAVHSEQSTVELDAGREEHVQLSFGGASLIGRVLDGHGDPVPGVNVSLAREQAEEPDAGGGGGGGFLSGLLGHANVTIKMDVNGSSGEQQAEQTGTTLFGATAESITTDENGDFELKYLSPGAWQVSAGGGAWIAEEPVAVDIDTDVTRVPDRVTLHVQRGATITGQVIEGSTEELLDDVRVELRDMDGRKVQRTRSKDGVYIFLGVPAGDYALVIEGDDGNRARRELQVGGGGEKLTAHLVTRD